MAELPIAARPMFRRGYFGGGCIPGKSRSGRRGCSVGGTSSWGSSSPSGIRPFTCVPRATFRRNGAASECSTTGTATRSFTSRPPSRQTGRSSCTGVLRQSVDETQAEEIVRLCGRDVPESIVTGPDLWNTSGKGPRGQSTAETFARVWGRLKLRAHLQKGDNDRLMGWRRVRQYLAPYTQGDGSRTALLQISLEIRIS